ncbi:hypothetical protein ACROYT_G011334 [Oculina patagonica]
MRPSLITFGGLLLFAVLCPWYSCELLNHEDPEISGEEPQSDPDPDPFRSYCQRADNPKGLGYIGVKYNLLRGNPEGNTKLGGIDPGLDDDKRILKLTGPKDKVPDQICYEPHQSCHMTKSAKIFGGTKSYQEKLNVDVTAKGGYEGLFDFSFSLSSKYEKMSKTTSNGETVYRDCTEICNKGVARYRLGLVSENKWTLADEFASYVCKLPIKYREGNEYFDFIEEWGTHVVIRVILGTKKITRFSSTLQEFMSFASENVGGSVSVSAGFAGVTGEVSVDVNNFEESEETNKEFGEEGDHYTVGDDTNPLPIQMELMSIEETLDEKFWGNLDELKKKKPSPCKKITKKKLAKIKKNIIKAIKDYPKRMKVKRAKDNPMKLPLAWPVGYFSLYSAKFKEDFAPLKEVCPQGTGFQWSTGSVTNRNRHFRPEPPKKSLKKIGFKGLPDYHGVKFSFCSKTEDASSEYFSPPQWPPGRYCILRKSKDPRKAKCPPKFETATVKWNDEGDYVRKETPVKEDEVPDGEYESGNSMQIIYCCRSDGFHSKPINLPIENPFILSKVHGEPCQKVCGAKETELTFQTSSGNSHYDPPYSTITGEVMPAGKALYEMLELNYCHYEKMDDDEFVTYKLVNEAVKARTAERRCVEEGGHLVSIHGYYENIDVVRAMGNTPRVWIGLKRRTVQNRPWVWYDGTEVDYGEWKPDVTDEQRYVSMSSDGSWEAQVNDVKLPFVCKMINDCPVSSGK